MTLTEIYLWGCAISIYLGLKFVIISYAKDDVICNFGLLEDPYFWKYCWVPVIPEFIGLCIILGNAVESVVQETKRKFHE